MDNTKIKIPITDNHIHIDPINGEGPNKIANIFYRAGGKVMIIPNKPSFVFDKPFQFKKAMDNNIKIVSKINEETSVKAFAIAGVHPAEFSKLINHYSLDKSYEMVCNALDYAQKLVLDGHTIAIGEVGRPHYEVSNEEWEYQNKILKYSISLAKDIDCPVQLHTETTTIKQYEEFSKLADSLEFKKYKLIKHFSPPITDKKENFGLTPSIIASRDSIKEALKNGTDFLMETDFLDDNRRPGAVLGPKTVPKRTIEFLNNGLLTEEEAYKIHKDNIERIYDI